MNAPVIPAEATALPASAVTLLEAFRDAHRPAVLRLWLQAGEQKALVFPQDEPGDESPAGITRSIHVENGTNYLLEIGRGHAAHLEFLSDVLSRVLGFEVEARSAARELTERYEEINLLYSISEILGAVLSVSDASERIVGEVADVMGARRASLWVHDTDERVLRLAAGFGEGLVLGPIPVDDPISVTARVFRDRQPLNLERDEIAPRGTRLEPRPLGQEAFLSVPINYTPPDGEARTVGVITLVGKSNERFSAGDMRLLSAIASQVGAALEMQRLMQESLRQERLVRELELAHDLQLKLLPDASQFAGDADVAARCAPAESVGGDFYHLFRLSGGRYGVMIGDVSGHGFSAALIMALTMSAVAISAKEGGPPGELLRSVHRAIIAELESAEMFIGLFYGVVDPVAGRLTFANAGHPHAFRVHSDGVAERLAATNPPLGMVPLDHYSEGSTEWHGGRDLLCLFTDGLAEAFAPAGSVDGEERLISEVVGAREQPTREILSHLFAISERARLTTPADDRSAVLLRV